MKFLYWSLPPVILIALFLIFFRPVAIVMKPLPDSSIVVGQNLVVGIYGTKLDASNVSFLEKVKPGGIVLYKYNLGTDDENKKLIQGLQEIALRTTGIPYYIMIDEEPEGATRLGIFRDALIGNKANIPAIDRDAKKLRDLGINVVLAPLADLEFGPKVALTHRTPISTDSAALVDFNKQFVSVLASNGIRSTLKHFPGLGFVEDDTHTDLRVTDASTSTLMKSIDVFKKGIGTGVDFVMMSNAICSSLDSTESAAISKKIIGMLRNDLGFKGLVITDDIANMPVGNPLVMPIWLAAKDALVAGNNMVLFGSQQKAVSEVYDKFLASYTDDTAMKTIFDNNYRMITASKLAANIAGQCCITTP